MEMPAPDAGFDLHFVSQNGQVADRLQNGDLADAPGKLRLPEDGFQHAARGGGRRHGVGDALDFAFRPGVAGHRRPDFDFKRAET